jgi:hypothetical protein
MIRACAYADGGPTIETSILVMSRWRKQEPRPHPKKTAYVIDRPSLGALHSADAI